MTSPSEALRLPPEPDWATATEAQVKAWTLARANMRPATLAWNNPTGVGVPLEALRRLACPCCRAAVPTSNLPTVRYGHVGSGDVLGVFSLTVTEAMAGRVVGQAVSVECKTAAGRLRPEQVAFATAFEARGGLALVCRDPGTLGLALDGFAGWPAGHSRGRR